MANTKPRYFTLGRAARRVGISAERLRSYANEGRLPHIRTEGGQRLITERALERFIQEREERAARTVRAKQG